jgi:hypothetical protein
MGLCSPLPIGYHGFKRPEEQKHRLLVNRLHLVLTPCSPLNFLPLFLNSIHTHMSCNGFFPRRHKEFGSLLITEYISAIKRRVGRAD